MSILRRVARKFRIGKEKYFVGTDLEGNSFYERPPVDSDDWKLAKRTVGYLVTKPLSEYRFESLPVQWNAWLRRTRQDPPTIEELEIDQTRQISLQNNVARLAIAYREEKLRGIEAPVQQSWATPRHLRGGVELGKLGEVEDEQVTQAESVKVGEVVDNAAAAKEIVEEDVVDEVIEGTAGEREKALLRRKFAKENAGSSLGNPGSTYEPEAWTPPPRKR